MRQHHFPGGDKSPPPGSLRVWQWRMLGSLASGSNPRWGWAESTVGTGAGEAGIGSPWVQARLRGARETWVPASVLPPLP